MGTSEGTIDQEILDQLQRRITELESQNRDYLGMMESSYDGLLIADGESKILYTNPSAERIIGVEYPASVGRTTRKMTEDGIIKASATLKVIESGKEETVVIKTFDEKVVVGKLACHSSNCKT